jgi:transcriptional regulator with XRE-family HTH domain
MEISQWKQQRPSDRLGLSLAQRLLKMRQLHGATQKQFAYRLGIGLKTYARWEKHGPPRHRLIRDRLYNFLDNMRIRDRRAKKEKSAAGDAG